MKLSKCNSRELCRRIPHQSGHAVEVGVVAGQMLEPVLAHDCDDERIPTEQAELLADRGGRGYARRGNRHHLDAKGGDVVNGLTVSRQ